MKSLIQAGVCAGLLLAAPAPFVQAADPKPAPVSPAYRLLGYVGDASLLKELALTPGQLHKLLASREKLRDEQLGATLQQARERRAEWDRTAAAAFKDVLILAPTQGRTPFARIDQLMLQSVAAVDLPKALARPEVAKVVALTPVQTVSMADLEDEYGRIAELVWLARLPLDRRDAVLRELWHQLDERILGLLTPEQAAKWKELTGEPYSGFVKSLVTAPPRRTTR
jgi:Spy/CpxP family protein refolding chaperone